LFAECASKKFFFKNWPIIGEDIDKCEVPRFMAYGVQQIDSENLQIRLINSPGKCLVWVVKLIRCSTQSAAFKGARNVLDVVNCFGWQSQWHVICHCDSHCDIQLLFIVFRLPEHL